MNKDDALLSVALTIIWYAIMRIDASALQVSLHALKTYHAGYGGENCSEVVEVDSITFTIHRDPKVQQKLSYSDIRKTLSVFIGGMY